MKLNIDLNYILKRIIVIVLAFFIISQLKSCNVQAMTLNPTLTNCSLYYSNNNKDTGTTVTGTYNNLSYRNCVSTNSRMFTGVSYNYQNTGISNGQYVIQFLVKKTNTLVNTPSITIMSGGDSSGVYTYNTCFISGSDGHSYDYQVTQGGNVFNGDNDYEFYSVYCPNSTIKSGWFQVYIQSSTNSIAGENSYNTFAISQAFNFTIIQDLSEAINNQGSQAHSDSQAINNSINDGSIDSSTNNGGGLFNVDSNGQSSIIPNNNFGLAGVITAPLVILNRAQEACTSKSFTIFNKAITLPCGDALFWNRDFSSQASIFTNGQSGSGLNNTRNGFRAVWNALFGGAIIFHLLVKLWDVIQRALDPNDNGYESISTAIDTGPKVTRDSDGDKDDPINSLRESSSARMVEEKDRRYHALKGRRA